MNPKNNKDHIQKICEQYGIDSRKNKAIKNMPYQELEARIKFLLENELPLTTDGQVHEIFFMSSVNMQEIYGISKEELIKNYYTIESKTKEV